jgi:pimeloyl-ACP methyl ester carboxylesterase
MKPDYERHGNGPALVLIHGAFSDHRSNWEFVLPMLTQHFTVYAIARRGRGASAKTTDHSIEDEARDAAELIESIGGRVFLLGHSYGAHVALLTATMVPDRIRKLVVYEPSRNGIFADVIWNTLMDYTKRQDWDNFAATFFGMVLFVPTAELEAARASEQIWRPILEDAEATVQDLRAIREYDFDASRFESIRIPVLLQMGSESPRHLWATDDLAWVLPDVTIGVLEGQGHEGMTTAPEQYAEAVIGFLAPNTAVPKANTAVAQVVA